MPTTIPLTLRLKVSTRRQAYFTLKLMELMCTQSSSSPFNTGSSRYCCVL